MPGLIALDFDGTLHFDGDMNTELVALMRLCAKEGIPTAIVTSRNEEHEHPSYWLKHEPQRVIVCGFCAQHGLRPKHIVFTSHARKGPFLTQIGASLLIDDDPAEIASAEACGVRGLLMRREPAIGIGRLLVSIVYR